MSAAPPSASTSCRSGPCRRTSGYGRLGARIGSWTSRGLVTALIVVAGAAVGRQVQEWWAGGAVDGERSPPAALAVGLGDPGQDHRVEFGNAGWSFAHRSVAGSREKAAAELRTGCRAIALEAQPAAGPPSAAEAALARSLAGCKPVAEGPEGWRLYELADPFPMAVVTRPDADAAPSKERRIVAWAVAAPAEPEVWTLFTFCPSRAGAESLPDLALPPGSHRVFGLGDLAGGAVVSFRGSGDPETWRSFFLTWFEQSGGRATHIERATDGLQLRGVLGADASVAVDIRFGPDGRGGLSGLLIRRPASTSKNTKDRS